MNLRILLAAVLVAVSPAFLTANVPEDPTTFLHPASLLPGNYQGQLVGEVDEGYVFARSVPGYPGTTELRLMEKPLQSHLLVTLSGVPDHKPILDAIALPGGLLLALKHPGSAAEQLQFLDVAAKTLTPVTGLGGAFAEQVEFTRFPGSDEVLMVTAAEETTGAMYRVAGTTASRLSLAGGGELATAPTLLPKAVAGDAGLYFGGFDVLGQGALVRALPGTDTVEAIAQGATGLGGYSPIAEVAGMVYYLRQQPDFSMQVIASDGGIPEIVGEIDATDAPTSGTMGGRCLRGPPVLQRQ